MRFWIFYDYFNDLLFHRLTEFFGATPQIHGYLTSYGAVAAALFSTFVVGTWLGLVIVWNSFEQAFPHDVECNLSFLSTSLQIV